MPPILMDVSRMVGRVYDGMLPTGVDRVMLAYMAHYRARARALIIYGGRWMVFSPRLSQHIFSTIASPCRYFRWWARAIVVWGYLLGWYRKPAVLMNTGHVGLENPSYAKQIRARGWKAVFFLHDLIPLTHREYFLPDAPAKHAKRVHTVLTVGSTVILNSKDAQQKLQQYAAEQGLPVPPSVVAFPAPAALLTPMHTPRPIPEPYFLVLSTVEPRKNHLLLLHVWRSMVETRGSDVPKLVIIGQRGWECEQVVDLLERCESLRDVVIEKSRCEDSELSGWLRHAQALLFPTFTEGFGIPLIEALAVRVPVIASNIRVFREIAGDIPEYLDPIDGPGWKQMILDYTATDSARRAAQLVRMADYVPPSWDAHFEQVDQFLSKHVHAFRG